MKKSDLKTGMLVEDREGNFALVMLGTRSGDALCGDDTQERNWKPLSVLNEDLFCPDFKSSDIMKIYDFSNNKAGAAFSIKERKLLWQRNEKVKITLTEDYSAEIDTDNKVINVGCQTIPFSKVEELMEVINKSK